MTIQRFDGLTKISIFDKKNLLYIQNALNISIPSPQKKGFLKHLQTFKWCLQYYNISRGLYYFTEAKTKQSTKALHYRKRTNKLPCQRNPDKPVYGAFYIS